MSLYCYVENNAVVGVPRTLPQTWNNISNFNALDDPTLLAYGWYPYVLVDSGYPGTYYDRTLSAFQIQSTEVVQTAIYTQWTIERLKNFKNGELENQIINYTTNERSINPKIDDYVNDDAEWFAGEQAKLARLTDWQNVADFDTTKPSPLVLPNSYVGASYVRQGVQLTAQNSAATDAGLDPVWDQITINNFISSNQLAADDSSNSVSPVQPTYEIRQGIAVPSEQFRRVIIYRESRDDPNPALRTTYKMLLLNRQDSRDLYIFSYTNTTYLAWHKFEDTGNGEWRLEASPAEWQYVPGDMAFIFSYGTNPAVEADYFTDRVEFPAGVSEMNILVAWDTI